MGGHGVFTDFVNTSSTVTISKEAYVKKVVLKRPVNKATFQRSRVSIIFVIILQDFLLVRFLVKKVIVTVF